MVAFRLSILWSVFLLLACSSNTPSQERHSPMTTQTAQEDTSTTQDISSISADTTATTGWQLGYQLDTTVHQSYRIATRSELKSGGNHINEHKTMFFTLRGLPPDDTLWRLQVVLDSFHVKVQIQPADSTLPPQLIDFRSSDPQTAPPSPKVQAFFTALHLPVTIAVTPRGQIVDIQNIHPIIDSLLQLQQSQFDALLQSGQANAAQIDSMKSFLRRELTQQISSEVYILLLQNLFTYYPDRQFSAKQWQRTYTTVLFDPVTAKNTATFQIASVDTAAHVARIKMAARAVVSPLEVKDSTGTIRIDPNYRYEGSGSAVIDLQTGLPKHKSYDMDILLPITITAQDSSQKILQSYTVAVQVSALK